LSGEYGWWSNTVMTYFTKERFHRQWGMGWRIVLVKHVITSNNVDWLSDFRGPIFWMLSSVFNIECRPRRKSSSVVSLPTSNLLNHSKTCVRYKHSFPYFLKHKIFVSSFPQFHKKLEVNSLLRLITLHLSIQTLVQRLERTITTARLSDVQLCPLSSLWKKHLQIQTCSNLP